MIAAVYTIIRNLRGSWPQWCADTDDGRVVFICIRYGEVRVGIGNDAHSASWDAVEVRSGDKYAGVVDVVTALSVLKELHYWYVCPPLNAPDGVSR